MFRFYLIPLQRLLDQNLDSQFHIQISFCSSEFNIHVLMSFMYFVDNYDFHLVIFDSQI